MTHKSRVSDLREGMLVDALPLALRFGGDATGLEFELASVECVAPAEPVDEVQSVILYTDGGSWKLPADYEVEVVG